MEDVELVGFEAQCWIGNEYRGFMAFEVYTDEYDLNDPSEVIDAAFAASRESFGKTDGTIAITINDQQHYGKIEYDDDGLGYTLDMWTDSDGDCTSIMRIPATA